MPFQAVDSCHRLKFEKQPHKGPIVTFDFFLNSAVLPEIKALYLIGALLWKSLYMNYIYPLWAFEGKVIIKVPRATML